MKKLFALTLALVMGLCLLAGCAGGGGNDSAPADTGDAATEPADTGDAAEPAEPADTGDAAAAEPAGGAAPAEGVMTHADYVAADLDSEVTVETYVQATQSWWEDSITVYAQSPDGAYFLYDMACSEEDAAKLVPGTKIRVTGYKSEWSGEVELTDATFEFVEGGDTFIAEPVDVTDILASDELADHGNEFVSFKGMTVEPSTIEGDDTEYAFLYNYDGSGEDGNDLYFNVSKDGQTYNFCVESYLCDNTTDVYNAVEALNVGDVIDMEGFLYWYEGPNPHITSVTPAA